uniref:Uncharacterized protein n=1 Tax=Tetradesmus obliquus TaxID=3088 RepID=A0A383W011_TETOB|eukprot:jgi/Sobl393_1/16745/SZX70479.1
MFQAKLAYIPRAFALNVAIQLGNGKFHSVFWNSLVSGCASINVALHCLSMRLPVHIAAPFAAAKAAAALALLPQHVAYLSMPQINGITLDVKRAVDTAYNTALGLSAGTDGCGAALPAVQPCPQLALMLWFHLCLACVLPLYCLAVMEFNSRQSAGSSSRLAAAAGWQQQQAGSSSRLAAAAGWQQQQQQQQRNQLACLHCGSAAWTFNCSSLQQAWLLVMRLKAAAAPQQLQGCQHHPHHHQQQAPLTTPALGCCTCSSSSSFSSSRPSVVRGCWAAHGVVCVTCWLCSLPAALCGLWWMSGWRRLCHSVVSWLLLPDRCAAVQAT